jgi:hypothetical protein
MSCILPLSSVSRDVRTVLVALTLAACSDDLSPAELADSGADPRDAGSAASTTRDAGSFVPGLLDGAVPDAMASGMDASASANDAALPKPEPVGLAGTGLLPLATSGAPLPLVDKKWTYVEFPDAHCRNGSQAGITVYRNGNSKRLMFFFEGGGACFDGLTCGANPEAVDATDKSGPKGGVLDVGHADNPFNGFHIVYVPYCTGDLFGGTIGEGKVEGMTTQKFVGYLNTQSFLQRVAPTFRDVDDLVVTGVSAGGFGASINFIQIQRAFPDARGKLIDDSGPPMPSSVLATCMQKKIRETWGFDGSMLAVCGSDCKNRDDFTLDFGVHLAKTFRGRYSGLIETTEDGIISGFFGAGSDPLGGGPCSGIALITPVDGAKFHAGVLAFREAIRPYATFGTFIPPGSQHTWLKSDSFYTGAVDGTKLVDWVRDIVEEKGTRHVGK